MRELLDELWDDEADARQAAGVRGRRSGSCPHPYRVGAEAGKPQQSLHHGGGFRVTKVPASLTTEEDKRTGTENKKTPAVSTPAASSAQAIEPSLWPTARHSASSSSPWAAGPTPAARGSVPPPKSQLVLPLGGEPCAVCGLRVKFEAA